MNIHFLEEGTVVLDDDIDLSGLRSLGEYRGFDISPDDDPLPAATGAEVLIINKTRMTEERIGRLKSLRLICVAATGYDNVDVPAAKKNGVHVANVAGYAMYSVAQQVFAFILKFYMKLDEYVADVRGGRWQKSRSFHLLIHPTLELAGKTLGVIGFGAIGRRVAEIGLAFHMRVLAYDIRDIHDEKTVQSTLEDVLTGSDIVSIHSPLTDQTRHLIGAAELGRMKRSAILINTARGGIVDESALADALNGGVIAGACVDTLSIEPPRRGNPLLGDVKNLYVTPHVAWTTRESRQRLMNGVAGNIERYLQGDLSGFIA